MDVGQAAAPAIPVASTGTVPAAAPDPVRGADASAGGATPPAASTSASASQRGGIAPAIAKLFGSASPPEPIRLDVSYRVLRDPDQIVTVFSDPKTGQEVAQFPPDILVGLAHLFDSTSGVTLDRDA